MSKEAVHVILQEASASDHSSRSPATDLQFALEWVPAEVVCSSNVRNNPMDLKHEWPSVFSPSWQCIQDNDTMTGPVFG